MDQVHLATFRNLLLFLPGNLLPELGDALPQLHFQAAARICAQLEHGLFFLHQPLDFGLFFPAPERHRHPYAFDAIALGLKPREPRRILVKAVGYYREISLGHSRIQLDKQIARLHLGTFFHRNLADHAAGWMLNLFHIGADGQHAMPDYCAGNADGRCQRADNAYEEGTCCQPREKVPVDAGAEGRFRIDCHFASGADTTFKVR